MTPAAPAVTAGPRNALTDVAGLLVGHHQRRDRGWLTGTTVVLTPAGTVAGVDVRGGGPGTRETDVLDPANLVTHVHAICLSGGSAYGLAAADGVTAWLGERHVGYPVGDQPHHVVPIVPAAVLFDLGRGGRFEHRPTAEFGALAAARARGGAVAQGTLGAGTGALAGGLKGGVGTASAVGPDGVTVAALVVVNAAGRVHDPRTGLLPGAARGLAGEFAHLRRPARHEVAALAGALATRPSLNTTLGVVATDATLTKAECRRLAMVAHDGLARAVHPAHGLTDGDTFFGLATGTRPLLDPAAPLGPDQYASPTSPAARLNEVLALAADCVTRAVVHAVLAATAAKGLPTYRDLLGSGVGATAAGR